MNTLEKNAITLLEDLKENYCAVGIKAEFENEGTSFEEALRLKELANKYGLNFTIKIGGCGAIKDIYDAKEIGANKIVAPMIESPYAMQKYVQALNTVFTEEERKYINFYINIETITGYKNLENIFLCNDFRNITGVVLGRNDMTGSMDLLRKDVNSEAIFNIAYVMSKQLQTMGKEMIVGGGVSEESIPFFAKLPYLSKFETRKIIFDAQLTNDHIKSKTGIMKAIEFEILWIKNKQEFYGVCRPNDNLRLDVLSNIQKSLCI